MKILLFLFVFSASCYPADLVFKCGDDILTIPERSIQFTYEKSGKFYIGTGAGAIELTPPAHHVAEGISVLQVFSRAIEYRLKMVGESYDENNTVPENEREAMTRVLSIKKLDPYDPDRIAYIHYYAMLLNRTAIGCENIKFPSEF